MSSGKQRIKGDRFTEEQKDFVMRSQGRMKDIAAAFNARFSRPVSDRSIRHLRQRLLESHGRHKYSRAQIQFILSAPGTNSDIRAAYEERFNATISKAAVIKLKKVYGPGSPIPESGNARFTREQIQFVLDTSGTPTTVAAAFNERYNPQVTVTTNTIRGLQATYGPGAPLPDDSEIGIGNVARAYSAQQSGSTAHAARPAAPGPASVEGQSTPVGSENYTFAASPKNITRPEHAPMHRRHEVGAASFDSPLFNHPSFPPLHPSPPDTHHLYRASPGQDHHNSCFDAPTFTHPSFSPLPLYTPSLSIPTPDTALPRLDHHGSYAESLPHSALYNPHQYTHNPIAATHQPSTLPDAYTEYRSSPRANYRDFQHTPKQTDHPTERRQLPCPGYNLGDISRHSGIRESSFDAHNHFTPRPEETNYQDAEPAHLRRSNHGSVADQQPYEQRRIVEQHIVEPAFSRRTAVTGSDVHGTVLQGHGGSHVAGLQSHEYQHQHQYSVEHAFSREGIQGDQLHRIGVSDNHASSFPALQPNKYERYIGDWYIPHQAVNAENGTHGALQFPHDARLMSGSQHHEDQPTRPEQPFSRQAAFLEDERHGTAVSGPQGAFVPDPQQSGYEQPIPEQALAAEAHQVEPADR